ncbi:hypothetical protein R1flu_022013 [Riccia fluitans]|uniref:VWFA domain-containing protein n=1 Tax=Riccia fluitans TaxID=41844 RepID=A0ABD1ZSG0_9MARC
MSAPALCPKKAESGCATWNVTKKRVDQICQVLKKAQEEDLAFLMDATGSMEDEPQTSCQFIHFWDSLEMVQNAISGMAASISRSYRKCKLRIALAVHRDYNNPVNFEGQGCNFTTDFEGSTSTFSKADLQM